MHPLGHMAVAGGTVWFGARAFGATNAATTHSSTGSTTGWSY